MCEGNIKGVAPKTPMLRCLFLAGQWVRETSKTQYGGSFGGHFDPLVVLVG